MAFWSRWLARSDAASPVQEALRRLVAALPDVPFALNPPATKGRLAEVEVELGYELPGDVRDLYLDHDGQSSVAPGLLGGMPFLTLASAMDDWRAWSSLADQDGPGADAVSFTVDAVRELYVNPGWFPLSDDFGGNNLGVDCDPGPAGTRGQLINFGRDEELKHVWAPSLSAFLTRIAERAESGRAVVARDGDDLRWGIEDSESWWPRYPDFQTDGRDADADHRWFEALEPAWQERVGGPEQVTSFLIATQFSSYRRDAVLPRISVRCRDVGSSALWIST